MRSNFHVELDKFAALIDKTPKVAVQWLATEAWTRIVQRMPVDTGRARSAWQLTVGEPSEFLPPVTGSYGGPVLDAVALARIDGKEVVWVVNNVEYVQYLEDGSSQQAPAGMVRITLAELEAEIEMRIEEELKT